MKASVWILLVMREPLSRSDVSGLIGLAFGISAWLSGSYGFLSSWGTFCAGICLGLVVRDRQQRAYERLMAEREIRYSQQLTEILHTHLFHRIASYWQALPKVRPGHAHCERLQ